jgi:hypothetical protein
MTSNINTNFDFYLNSDLSKFNEGEWIVIYNNKIISHGKKLSLVTKNAEKIAPLSKMLISKVKKTMRYL